ncbi:hypothetical protein WMY93_026609 [Mugilogobius chulae]|uniref:Uncharacterized protein n=1 Tax=Mugilogobius chulae TaxID=88201 RepID=A0AAW0N2F9_9GOBI
MLECVDHEALNTIHCEAAICTRRLLLHDASRPSARTSVSSSSLSWGRMTESCLFAPSAPPTTTNHSHTIPGNVKKRAGQLSGCDSTPSSGAALCHADSNKTTHCPDVYGATLRGDHVVFGAARTAAAHHKRCQLPVECLVTSGHFCHD